MSEKTEDPGTKPYELPIGHLATGKRPFPNVPVITHKGEQKIFYDDFIKSRIVLMHFISSEGEKTYPVLPYVRRTASLLKKRLNRDVFIVSITSDPATDDVATLNKLAEKFSIPDGWTLLSGDPDSIQTLHAALFVRTTGYDVEVAHHHRTSPAQKNEEEVKDCSVGLMRYGNDATGFWGSVPVRARPEFILEKLSWLTPETDRKDHKPVMSAVRRKGPFPQG